MRADLLEKVQMASALCLTTDCWTSSCTTTGYMTVTCHFVTSEFKLQSNLLDCFELTDSHTSAYLAEQLQRVANDWHITNKIVACVSDSAANIKKAVKDILRWNHVSCFAHIVNLIVRSATQQPEMQEIIKKVKSITEFTRRSTVATAKLREMQQQMGQPQLILKQDVATRWNSTYYMLKRITEVKEPLISTLALINPQLQVLSQADWEIIKEACDVLQPFEEVTVELSAEKFVTGSKAILMARGLQRSTAHHQRNPNLHKPVKEMVGILMAEITRRLGGIEQVGPLADATLLDPRFKKHAFVHERHAEEAVTRTVGAISRSIRKNTAASNAEREEAGLDVRPATNEPMLWADFEERVATFRPGSQVQNPLTEAMLEIKGYLSEHLLLRTNDPLEWWRSRATVFKNACDVMKTRLCVVATSVPSERIFSKTGQILTDRRNRLTSRKVQQLVFLNANL
ncbi:unnamed protein product [Knipowitschia caucasica]